MARLSVERPPDLLYGYWIHGPFAPKQGHRFNLAKLLLDPYAKKIWSKLKWNDSLFTYHFDDQKKDFSLDDPDSTFFMLMCRVIDPTFSWPANEKALFSGKDTDL